MENKSIFTEEELMQCSKEFLCATVLRQEKQAEHWFAKYIELQKEFNQFMSNEINNKEKLLK
tara:strand:- start:207 stop:392 length:186 start_codon:yes stop_codon:yes gene_type:complete